MEDKISRKKGYQKYTSEFKEETVRIAMNIDQPYSTTAKELGINLGTFYKWTNDAMNNQINPSNQNKKNMNTKILEIEIKELRKKLKKTALDSSNQCNRCRKIAAGVLKFNTFLGL